MSVATRLTETLAAVCPVVGVGPLAGGALAAHNVRIDYDPAATRQQRDAAAAALAAFDWSPAAHAAWIAEKNPEKKGLADAAQQAVADNNAFLAIANPTNAQLAAQLRAVTRQLNRIIPRLLQVN